MNVMPIPMGAFQVEGRLAFDKPRANEKACPFALGLSEGKFTPKLKYAGFQR